MQRMGVLGVDSSTQSCKVVLVDAETGELLETGSANHPDGTEIAPQAWAAALDSATEPLLDRATAVSVAGQQHGLVALDSAGRVVRKALLWNDTRSAAAADRLRADYGEGYWIDTAGMLPDAALTVAKLAWIAASEPGTIERTEEIVLPHDWLTGRLLHRDRNLSTDASEASGTGYFSPACGYNRPLVEAIAGKPIALPRVLGPSEIAGHTAAGMLVAPGAADNAAAAFGLELNPGEVVVSLGTSGTVFTNSASPYEIHGGIANFVDCEGRFLPLVCTLNAARVLTQTAELLGTSLDQFSRLAVQAPVDAGGMLLLPFLDGERYPSLPQASGTLIGMRRSTMTPGHLAQAATLGMLCGIADALDGLLGSGNRPDHLLLIGGAARSPAVRAAAPAILGCAISLPAPREYVALGAARQAAWALSGEARPPRWGRRLQTELRPPSSDWGDEVRARYHQARSKLHPE